MEYATKIQFFLKIENWYLFQKAVAKKVIFWHFFSNIVDVCFLYYSSGTKKLWFHFGSTNVTTYLCDYIAIMEPKIQKIR